MNAEQWNHVADLFQQAVALSPTDREALLRQATFGPEVRDQVERLLVGDAGAEERGFLSPPGSSEFPGEQPPDPFAAARRGFHLLCPHCHHAIEVVQARLPPLYTCELCGTTIRTDTQTPVPPPPELGETLNWEPSVALRRFGRFSLIHWLGEGGNGIVYKARDPQLERIVALKIPRLGNLGTQKDRESFLREAQAAGQLSHQNIVPIFESGEVDGTPYILSEFVEGVTLADLLSDSGPAPGFDECARIAIELAEALQHAHDAGVVHRDVKPSNIMIDRQGRPRLMDFGLAKRDATEFTIAVSGRPLGTPAYMSPEQARGEGRHVDGRTDVYGLGAVLYFLITGSSPFAGTERMILQKVIHDDPPSPRSLNERIPRDLQTICQKAMAKEAHRRYTTASKLASDLRRFLNKRPIEARPIGLTEKAWRLCVRNPRLSLAIGTAVALLIAVAVISTVLAITTYRAETARTRELSIADHQLAVQLLERGETGPGLLWLERSLELARQVGDADLAHLAEASLAAWSRQHPPLQAIFSHPSEVRRAASSPDGKTLVAICADGTAQLWDVARNDTISGPLRLRGKILSVAFSPDGLQLLTGDEDGSLQLWDPVTGRRIGPDFTGPLSPLREVAFGEAGQTVIAIGSNGTFRRWDSRTGLLLGGVIGRPCVVTTAVISRDGLRGLVASTTRESSEVRLWDLVTGNPIGTPLEHANRVFAAAFSPDGKIAATGCADSLVRLWDTSTGALIPRTWRCDDRIISIVFSPDGTALLSATGEKTTRIWEIATGLPRGDELVTSGQMNTSAFSPDGRIVTMGGPDGRARLWDARTGKPLGLPLPHLASLSDLSFLPDGKSILACSGERIMRLWSISPSDENSIALASVGREGHAALSADGSFVVTGNELGEVRVFSSADGREIQPAWRHGEPVDVVALSGDAQRVLVGGMRGKAQLYRLADGQPIGPVHSFNGSVGSAAFSGDGTIVVMASDDFTGRVIDARSGMARGAAFRHNAAIERLAVNVEGSVVATGSSDRTVRLWDGATGAPLGSPLDHEGRIMDLALSPDGRRMLTANFGGPARLWDVASRRPIFKLEHVARILVARFSPDGKTALTGGSDGKIRLWDVATGTRKPPILSGIGDIVPTAVFSDDGRLIAAAGRNGEIRLWDAIKGLPIGPRFGVPGFQVHGLTFHPRRDKLLSRGGDGVARLWTIAGPSTMDASGLTGLDLNDQDEVVAMDGPTLRKSRESKPAAKP
jgi:eukaryotic-like serine/threonine-protein kinase